MKPAILLENITKVFSPSVTALHQLNLSIPYQQIFGLLGPNGSGKTTTIKLILGLIFPTQGSVEVLGEHPQSPFVKYNIGYQPEESYFYPFLNAYEILHFYAKLYGMNRKKRKKRIQELLQLVGLKPKEAKRKIKTYSKGMTRRMGLAQALLNDPKLLILDEPTSGMDPIGSREFKDLLLQLRQQGKTILLSSHLLADVEDTCDTIAILYQGKKVKEGNVQQLLHSQNITQICVQNYSPSHKQEILQLLSQKNIQVIEILQKKYNLEELFLQTIQEQNAQHS